MLGSFSFLRSPESVLNCNSAPVRSSNVLSISGGRPSLSFSLPFQKSAFGEATEALAEPLSSTFPSLFDSSPVWLLSSVSEDGDSSPLSDLAEFDSLA